MIKIDYDTVADLHLSMEWESNRAVHREELVATNFNLWRDILPEDIQAAVTGKKTGDSSTITGPAGRLVMDADKGKAFSIRKSQFESQDLTPPIAPRPGRFYPKGILRSVPNVFRQNIEPFRLIDVQNGNLAVDFKHPLAGKDLKLTVEIGDIRRKAGERGGTSRVWIDELASGPGMQSRWQDRPTDFFSDAPFHRKDEQPDREFYERPRFVNHIDAAAIRIISDLYGRLIEDDMRVLDLMGSWVSHIPEHLSLKRLTGLGMNAAELDKNPRLTDRIVHDLNSDPVLPFDTGAFDAVVCTVSVEYLSQPFAVFEELARVLVPGGLLIVTFSNRWFPPKAIRIWPELHEFERLGLVSEYFFRTERFTAIETLSARGLPRPTDDPYFPEQITSDPVYAVWGYTGKDGE